MQLELSSMAVMSKVLQSTCEGRDFHRGHLSEPVPSSLNGTSNLALEKTLLQELTELMQSVFKMIVDFGQSIILSNPLIRLLHSVVYRSNAVEPEASTSAVISSDVIEPEASASAASSSNAAEAETDSAANSSNPIEPKASARIALLKNLVSWQLTGEKNANERLIAVQNAGLLVEIDQQNINNAQSDYIEYLTSAQTISEIIKLNSKGVQFNLPAFLKVRPDLLKSGVLGALAEFEQDDLTEKQLSKVFNFFSSLRPQLAQENTDYPELEKKLEELKQLGLSKKNCSVIRDLAPMVQCGIFVNRIEDPIDPSVHKREVTPLYYSSVINSNPTHVRILIAAGADLDRPSEAGAKSDFVASSNNAVELEESTSSPSPQQTLFSQKLPAELYLEVQKYLSGFDLLNLLGNFIIPTRLITEPAPRREQIDSPALRLHLLLRNVPSQYQYDLANRNNDLQKFILDQFERLWDSGQFEQVIEKPALFKLLRLVDRIELFNFLQERIEKNPDLKEVLFDWVERSKTKEVQKIAANALELLVKAGIPMSGKDFQGIRVPGADLSYGVFNSTQLQGANLTGVKLRATNLHKADLSGAQMARVQFGEWPYLQEDSIVFCCVFSPDGTTCALGLGDRTVHVYNTSSWDKIHTLTGHANVVQSVAYSPDGRYIASSCNDTTLWLWDVQSGELHHSWGWLSDNVTKLAFSPNGEQIVTAAYRVKGGVHLLDAQNGERLHTLHKDGASDVAYSPDGRYIASCGQDGNVQVWGGLKKKLPPVKIKHFIYDLSMETVTFSPNSKQLAFGGLHGKVYISDLQGNGLPRALGGNPGISYSLQYSIDCSRIIANRRDKGSPPRALEENLGGIYSLSYSPDGTRIAAGRSNGIVQLWDVESGALLYTFKGNSWAIVKSVTFSPDGTQIAAGSSDHTMRLWEVHKERKNYKVRPQEYSENLNIKDMQIQGVQGLSTVDTELLEQGGAVNAMTEQEAIVQDIV